MHPVLAHAVAALIPAGLIAAAALAGGVWPFAALGFITLVAFFLDRVIAPDTPAAADRPMPAADALSVVLALVHFALLALVIAALAGGWHGAAQALALYVAAALFFGQVSNSNAHELIHRADRRLFGLGKWVYISLLFGHHTSAHNKIHHRFAASDDDPNSARPGESFYAFAPRAWVGSFVKGWQVEEADRARARAAGRAARMNPYVTYLGGAGGLLVLSGLAFGWAGVAAHLALAAYAQAQLLLSDYVQHYGLRRARLADGRLEPMGLAHSWNAGQWFTARMMLNAPRHSDHHAHPARPYPALTLPGAGAAPRLPASLPAMAVVALVPGWWRRVMARALKRWDAARATA